MRTRWVLSITASTTGVMAAAFTSSLQIKELSRVTPVCGDVGEITQRLLVDNAELVLVAIYYLSSYSYRGDERRSRNRGMLNVLGSYFDDARTGEDWAQTNNDMWNYVELIADETP